MGREEKGSAHLEKPGLSFWSLHFLLFKFQGNYHLESATFS